MRHLLNNIKASNYKVLAQFKAGDLSYDLKSMEKSSSISINGHEIIDCSSAESAYDKVAHLIKDLIVTGMIDPKPRIVQAYVKKEIKLSNSIFDGLKKDLGSSVKIVTQSMEIPNSAPVKFNLEEAFAPNKVISKMKEFSQSIHDINETLRVCREDILSIASGRLINTMWGAKPTQQILVDMKKNVCEDSDWEKIEFYTNISIKSIDRLIHKLNVSLFDVCDEEKKVVNTVLIPNIIQNFEKIKTITSNVLMMLSNFVYIDEVFKKNTSYPASWFINSDMFEDIKLDYKNLILFVLKIPRFEQEIIYPLDMMRHSFINKNEIRQ